MNLYKIYQLNLVSNVKIDHIKFGQIFCSSFSKDYNQEVSSKVF